MQLDQHTIDCLLVIGCLAALVITAPAYDRAVDAFLAFWKGLRK